jgi:bacitracin transport system permease protein
VDQTVFERLKQDLNPSIQKEFSIFIGINLKDKTNLEKVNNIFKQTKFNTKRQPDSLLERTNQQKRTMGLTMFIVGFLGLTFLITSGCILYFKQIGESAEEKPNYYIEEAWLYGRELTKGHKVQATI